MLNKLKDIIRNAETAIKESPRIDIVHNRVYSSVENLFYGNLLTNFESNLTPENFEEFKISKEENKEIVKNFDIPIIISSARSDITDKVTALQLGADDYLPKPYDPRELEVRIKTILRRFNHSNIQDEPINKTFLLDNEKRIFPLLLRIV